MQVKIGSYGCGGVHACRGKKKRGEKRHKWARTTIFGSVRPWQEIRLTLGWQKKAISVNIKDNLGELRGAKHSNMNISEPQLRTTGKTDKKKQNNQVQIGATRLFLPQNVNAEPNQKKHRKKLQQFERIMISCFCWSHGLLSSSGGHWVMT